MLNGTRASLLNTVLIMGGLGFGAGSAAAAVNIEGQVQAGGGPVAHSTVTLWAASTSAPKQFAQATTGADGRFTISSDQSIGSDAILYLVSGRSGWGACQRQSARESI